MPVKGAGIPDSLRNFILNPCKESWHIPYTSTHQWTFVSVSSIPPTTFKACINCGKAYVAYAQEKIHQFYSQLALTSKGGEK